MITTNYKIAKEISDLFQLTDDQLINDCYYYDYYPVIDYCPTLCIRAIAT